MNIQIITTGKGFDLQKTIRYFKERRISFQLVELSRRRSLSKGELDSITKAIKMEDLVDSRNKAYSNLNIEYYGLDSETVKDLIINNPGLMKTPVVRNGRQATVGYCPDIWSNWE